MIAGDPRCRWHLPNLIDAGRGCGDSRRDPGEVCDDGNTTSGDGCRADCRSDETCGNGQRDPGETCDDGNDEDGDGCCSCTVGSALWGNAALFGDPSWSQWCGGGECAWHAPLYCFQQ